MVLQKKTPQTPQHPSVLISERPSGPPTKYTECWSVGMYRESAGHAAVGPLSTPSRSKSFVLWARWRRLAARASRVLPPDPARGLKQLFGRRSSADGQKYDPGLIPPPKVLCSCAHRWSVKKSSKDTLYISDMICRLGPKSHVCSDRASPPPRSSRQRRLSQLRRGTSCGRVSGCLGGFFYGVWKLVLNPAEQQGFRGSGGIQIEFEVRWRQSRTRKHWQVF